MALSDSATLRGPCRLLSRQPAGGFKDVIRYTSGPTAPDGLEHPTRWKRDAQLQPMEPGVAPVAGIDQCTTRRTSGLSIPKPNKGGLLIKCAGNGGICAQVASGKLRECAGCALQCDTQTDTLESLPYPVVRNRARTPYKSGNGELRWFLEGRVFLSGVTDPVDRGLGLNAPLGG